ncbi:MAG: hypothetical protein HYX78_06360 [Armatimonadetes bacterium]|nr:hypothetical protein [Armatimonadota bacterium]
MTTRYAVCSVFVVGVWLCLGLGAYGKIPDALLIYDNSGTETNGCTMADLDRDGRAEYIAAVKSERLDYLLAYGLTTSDENRPKPVPIDGFIPKSSPDGKLSVRGPEIILAWGWDTFNRGPLWVLTGDFNGDGYPDVMTLCMWGQWEPYPIGVFYRDPKTPFPSQRAHELSALWNIQREPVGAPKPDIPIPKESPWRKEGWLDDRAVRWATGYSNPMRVFPGDEKEYVAIGNYDLLLLGRDQDRRTPPGHGTWTTHDAWHEVGVLNEVCACALGDLTGDGNVEAMYFRRTGEIGGHSYLGGQFPDEQVSTVELVRAVSGPKMAPFDGVRLPATHPKIGRWLHRHPGQFSGRLAIGDPSRDGKNELIVAAEDHYTGYLLSYQRRQYGPGETLDSTGAWDYEIIDILPKEKPGDLVIADYDADGVDEILLTTDGGHIFAYRRKTAGYAPGNVAPLKDYSRRTLWDVPESGYGIGNGPFPTEGKQIRALAVGNMDGDPSNGNEIGFCVAWGRHYILYNTRE